MRTCRQALRYVREVLERELDCRLLSFCVERDDGAYDESAASVQERRLIGECRRAIGLIDGLLGELPGGKRK